MSYITNLRKKIGKDIIIMPCATVILINEKNQVLLQKRVDNNKWGLNGGSIEIDENTLEAAKRELFEETSLIADSLELFDVYSGPKFHFKYPNGDEVNTIDIVYVCKKYHGKMKPQKEEVQELVFFDEEDLPLDMMNNNDVIIHDYYKKQKEK